MGVDARTDPGSAEELLASRVDADRTEILDALRRGLEAIDSPIAADPASRERTLSRCGEVLTDVIASLCSGSVQVTEDRRLSNRPGESCASRGLPPQESLRAAAVFHEIAYEAALAHVDISEHSRRLLTLVGVALNRSISVFLGEATTGYQAFLLDRVRDAHIAERHRIARELHDRVGGALSTAHRMMELHEMLAETDPARAADRLDAARNTIAEAMDGLRSFMSCLRTIDQVTSIEKALLRFVDTAPADGVDIRLRVTGDETWTSPVVRDETYMILREATRNALTHGRPSTIAISVDIAPHELRASVVDDGCGFDQSRSGDGLASMRERAVLLGGYVTLSTGAPGGTSVELFIPLPAGPDPRDRPVFPRN